MEKYCYMNDFCTILPVVVQFFSPKMMLTSILKLNDNIFEAVTKYLQCMIFIFGLGIGKKNCVLR